MTVNRFVVRCTEPMTVVDGDEQETFFYESKRCDNRLAAERLKVRIDRFGSCDHPHDIVEVAWLGTRWTDVAS